MMSADVETVAQRVADAVNGMAKPATLKSKTDDAVFWSVITRRAGAKLHLHTSPRPALFAAMTWAKPQVEVSLGKLAKGAEATVLRRASALLALPAQARAIPFSLLTGGSGSRASDIRVCGAALPKGFATVAAFKGHDDDIALQTIALSDTEVVAFNVDGDSPKFGLVTWRYPISELTQFDLDEGKIGLFHKRREPAYWDLLNGAGPEELEAAADWATRHNLRLRRKVEVAKGTFEFRA